MELISAGIELVRVYSRYVAPLLTVLRAAIHVIMLVSGLQLGEVLLHGRPASPAAPALAPAGYLVQDHRHDLAAAAELPEAVNPSA